MRIRIILAAVVAMLTMSAAPAYAITGWTFHSGGYNDDPFVATPCLDTGQALVNAGTIADFQCRWRPNGLVDLYIVHGPWTLHSGGYNDDIFFQNPCMDLAQSLIANGTVTTAQCRWGGSGGLVDLWVIV